MNQLLLKSMLAAAVAPFIFCASSCSSNDEPIPEPTPTQKANVKFRSSISPMSRATDLNFEEGDRISVFAIDSEVNSNGQLQAHNYADAVEHEYSNGLFSAVNQPIQYSNSPLFFKAVYPAVATQNEFAYNIQTNQSTHSNYTKSDLMIAETVATTDEIPELVFKHYLSNIIVNLHYENDRPVGNETVTFKKLPYSYSFNINQKKLTLKSETQDVVACSNGIDSYKMIALPNKIKGGTELMVLTIGNKDLSWVIEQDFEWKSGKQYTYDLTVSAGGKLTFTATILPWGEDVTIEEIVPPSLLDEMEKYIPIHRGVNPPNVEGSYYIDPQETVYCQDQDHGGFEPGYVVTSQYIRFFNQNNKTLTLDYESQTATDSQERGYGSFISGEGNNFTVYFNTNGYYQEITYRTALVISGTKTSSGISNLRYAFVMVEKNNDLSGTLMAEGVFRIFKDSDELAANCDWAGLSSRSTNFTASSLNYIFTRLK